MTYQKSTAHIVLITIITVIMATCIVSIYFQEVNAQYYRNDDNDIKLEPIRHMMDRRHHMMMEDGQQEQKSSMSNYPLSSIESKWMYTKKSISIPIIIDNQHKNLFQFKIVFIYTFFFSIF